LSGEVSRYDLYYSLIQSFQLIHLWYSGVFDIEFQHVVHQNLKNKLLQINLLVFLDCFDVLMSKLNLKHIILIYFKKKYFEKQLLPHFQTPI
jgi:hypothetical protein